MIVAVLSYFDRVIGPRVVMKFPLEPQFQLDHVAFLMDFYEEGFFIHEFGDLKTANYIFSLVNPDARGQLDILMISIIVLDEILDLKTFQEVLKFFMKKLKSIDHVYEGLYIGENNNPIYPNKKQRIVDLLSTFYQSLPLEKEMLRSKFSKLLFLGLNEEGINIIVQNLKNTLLGNNNIHHPEIKFTKSILGNISILTFNLEIKNYFNEILSIYFKEMDGIVFIIDFFSKIRCGEIRNPILFSISHEKNGILNIIDESKQ